MSLTIGSKAPDFNLASDGGDDVRLSSFKGRKVALYFYPKDDTSGCTAQACDFRDSIAALRSAKCAVLGISRDPIDSHKKFKAKYGLNFPLLSDVDGSACEAYGVWVQKSMYGRNYMGIERSTFLIGEDGRIESIWRKVSVPGHVAEILSKLKPKKKSAAKKPAAKKSVKKKAVKKKVAKKAVKKPIKKSKRRA